MTRTGGWLSLILVAGALGCAVGPDYRPPVMQTLGAWGHGGATRGHTGARRSDGVVAAVR
jgi:hypothetical protein